MSRRILVFLFLVLVLASCGDGKAETVVQTQIVVVTATPARVGPSIPTALPSLPQVTYQGLFFAQIPNDANLLDPNCHQLVRPVAKIDSIMNINLRPVFQFHMEFFRIVEKGVLTSLPFGNPIGLMPVGQYLFYTYNGQNYPLFKLVEVDLSKNLFHLQGVKNIDMLCPTQGIATPKPVPY